LNHFLSNYLYRFLIQSNLNIFVEFLGKIEILVNEYLIISFLGRFKKSSLLMVMMLLTFLFAIDINPLQAQIPKTINTNSSPTQSTSSDLLEIEGPDSTIYNYVLLNDIFKLHTIDDSLASISFLHKDPMWHDGNELVNTGNRGSASYPLLYRPNVNIGFNDGYNQYYPYKLNLANFKFYEQNRPIADLNFSQLADQQNISVGAEFSRNFSNGLSFSINYKRLSQKGFFANQNTKSTNFGAGLRYKSKNERYNAFLIFIQNANEENHNGGILNLDDLNEQFLTNIPTILSDAKTRQQEQTYGIVQYYKLSRSTRDAWRIYLRNDLVYMPSYFQFGDDIINDSSDSLFYGNLAIDNRGIRRNLEIDHFKNAFYIHGEKIKGASSRLGITYDRFAIINGSDSTRNDLTLSYDGRLPILNKFFINVSGKLGLLKNAGNFDLTGQIEFNPSSSINLNTGIKFFNSEQNYNAQFLRLNDQIIINQNLDKSLGSILFGELQLIKLKFKASIAQSVVNKPVYWDTSGKVVQDNGVISVTSLSIAQNFRLWKLHFDNHLHFQILSDKIYPLPSFYSTHQLYYANSVFKKAMDINFGLDIRLINDYRGGQYQPVFGTYHLSDTNLPFFPAVNLYLMARISTFRVILMMENFSQSFVSEHNFDVINHPQFGSKFRFSVQWLLKD
jgi:hypothetical protein